MLEKNEIKWRSNIPHPRPWWKDSNCTHCQGWGSVPFVHGLCEVPCPNGCEIREKPVKTGKAMPIKGGQ